MSVENSDGTTGDNSELDPLEDDGASIPVTTLVGAAVQLIAAVLFVFAIVALFIAGAVVFRWIFG